MIRAKATLHVPRCDPTSRISIKIADFCRRHHMRSLKLFGSILRNDFGPESDVDVLVEFEEGHTPGWDFFSMQEELAGEVAKVRESYMEAVTEAREAVDKINAKYTELEANAESLVVADGSKVAAREMIIRAMSVGKLTVKVVTCVVMPQEKGDIDPLLGQSFPRRFDIKLTQGAGGVTLTKVEPDEPAATPARKSGARKKR